MMGVQDVQDVQVGQVGQGVQGHPVTMSAKSCPTQIYPSRLCLNLYSN
jgi:hypothetical protein